jgi:hypothetical protein
MRKLSRTHYASDSLFHMTAEIATSSAAAKRPYAPPTLRVHGDLKELTKAEYGGLDTLLYGSIFAMSSPGLPGAPNR